MSSHVIQAEDLLTENRLEEPCLEHVHGDPSKPDEPNGHGLTTTSQLLYVCQPSPSRRLPFTLRTSYNSAPATMLARLLNLSPDLSSDGEITPIQAWHNILCRPHFGGMESQSLRVLAEKLRGAVKCHGQVNPHQILTGYRKFGLTMDSFGAVVQQAIFEEMVYETLVVGREL